MLTSWARGCQATLGSHPQVSSADCIVVVVVVVDVVVVVVDDVDDDSSGEPSLNGIPPRIRPATKDREKFSAGATTWRCSSPLDPRGKEKSWSDAGFYPWDRRCWR